jgi:GNAT superfamily N-acetyltransferase
MQTEKINSQIEYKIMKPGEEQQIIDVVISTFDEFVAPQYSVEGVNEFRKYANVVALAERSLSNHFTVIAKKDGRAVGVIEVKEFNHVSMLFVKKDFQNIGIGKSLFHMAADVCLKNRPTLKRLTVNASPNSVHAYKKIGFIPDDTEQLVNGIRFIPMSRALRTRELGDGN